MKRLALHFTYHMALLFVLPVLFILAYVWLYFNPSITIYEHLSAVSLFVLSIISIKLLINHYFSNKKLILFVGTMLYSSFLYALIIYYSLVFISLNSWNRVITEEFIMAYMNQARFFFTAIGISYHLVIFALVAGYTLFAIATYFFLKKFHWLPSKHPNSTWLIGPLLLSLSVFFIYQLHDYLTSYEKLSKEPLKLTLFSGKPKLQTHDAELDFDSNAELNKLEDHARQNYQPTESNRKRNLIVFLVDGLRPDHTSFYNYERDTTPKLKKITEQHNGRIYTNLRSVCGETTCAHAGYMSSRFVHQLTDNLFTLQEVLKLNGYKTNLIISGDHINFHNIREVYGEVDDYYDGTMAKGYYFNDDIITVNKTRSLPIWDGQPTMIHYHILSAHQVGQKYPEFEKFKPSANYIGFNSGQPDIKYTNFYDNGVLQTDHVVNKILQILGEKKYLQNALVVITADHGDALGEHHIFNHTNSVIEEALKIPLVMIPYGYESELPERHDNFMSLVDLAPSILKEFDLNIPETWVGTPLQEKNNRKFSYFEMSPYKGLYDHRDQLNLMKYWQNKNTGEEFVFNISKDPKENHNLVWNTPASTLKEWRELNKITSITQTSSKN